jgi:hypothetical protein
MRVFVLSWNALVRTGLTCAQEGYDLVVAENSLVHG